MDARFVDTKKLAREIEEKILRRFESDWARACEDGSHAAGLKALYISDAGDMLEVCRYISQGHTRAARAALLSMDTAPREDMFGLIEETAGSDFVDSW